MADYINSSNITVFPAGFRSDNFANARLTTEKNLTQFKLLSAHSSLNNYYYINDEQNVVIGIQGYVFVIDSEDVIPDTTYAYLKTRTLGDNEVLDNIENSGDLLDVGSSSDSTFQGLAFSDTLPDGIGNNYINLKSASKLKLAADEIADFDGSSKKPISDTFTTNNINVLNELKAKKISIDNLVVDGNQLQYGDSDTKQYIEIGNKSIEAGTIDKSQNPPVKSGTIILKSDATSDPITVTFNSDIIFPSSESGNFVLISANKNAEWRALSSDPNANSVVIRDNSGKSVFQNIGLNAAKNAELLGTDSQGNVIAKNLTSFKATTDALGMLKVAKTNNQSVGTLTADPVDGAAEGLQIDNNGRGYVVLPKATSSTLGGIKAPQLQETGSDAVLANSGIKYTLQTDEQGRAFTKIPKADSDNFGSIQLGYPTSDANRNYAVKTSNGKAYVNVPWVGGDYTLPQASKNTLGGVKLGFQSDSSTIPGFGQYALMVNSEGKAYTTVPKYMLPAASSSLLGGIRINDTLHDDIGDLPISQFQQSILADVEVRALPLCITSSGNGQKGFVYLPEANGNVLGGIKAVNSPKPTAGTAALYIDTSTRRGYIKTTTSSDIRLKENIRNFESEKSILDLSVVKFDFKDGAKNQIGCIAQDLQQICPELVVEDENGYLQIKENKLVYLLLEEVKKLKIEIDNLKSNS